jgi:predicted amidophosphoribosyltransferase
MISACIVCHAMFWEDRPLCGHCSDLFYQRVSKRGPVYRRLPVFTQSLWSWNDRFDGVSRAIIYSLKRCDDPSRWRWFSQMLLHAIIPPTKDSCLIPIPSKNRKKPNHAAGLSQAIQELTGYPIENCLVSGEVGHQRKKNREERQAVQFIRSQDLGKAYSTYILVDDVITSGSTLAAAFKALGQPKSTQALCFMDRPLL